MYPEFLSTEQKDIFELHLQGCEYCRERWKLWQTTGIFIRIEALRQRAGELLEDRQYDEAVETILMQASLLLTTQRYEEALEAYNRAIELNPQALDTEEGQELFQTSPGLPLTAARNRQEDIMDFFDPEKEVLAAAKASDVFPLSLEYADGKVKGEFTTAGQLVFFELKEVSAEYQTGVKLLGKVIQGSQSFFTLWEVRPERKKTRLGTMTNLFGSPEFPDVVAWLQTFKVFPMSQQG